MDCTEVDCSRRAHAKGLCGHHYYLANKARYKESSDRWRKQNPEATKEIRRRYANRNPEKIQELHRRHSKPPSPEKRATMNAAKDQTQKITQAASTRKGHTYTGWELELIADETRSVREVALATGRTYAAISRMRSQVRKDPKTISRAGIASDGSI